MPDYLPLIERALAGPPEPTPAMRAAVYQRAREALDRHLRSMRPALAETDIARERLALDDVIARVEAERYAPAAPARSARPSAPGSRPLTRGGDGTAAAPPGQARTAAMPEPARRMPGWMLGLGAAGLALVTGAVAALGVVLKDDPARWRPRVEAVEEGAPPAPPTLPPKIVTRVGAEAEAPPAAPPPTAPPATPPPATPPAPPPGGPGAAAPPPLAPATPATPVAAPPPEGALPVAQRAEIIEETDNPREPRKLTGRAVWQLRDLAVDRSRPAEAAVVVDVSFPEGGPAVKLTFRRNMDRTFQVSHTIEIEFTPAPGAGAVRAIQVPQWKTEEPLRGAPLAAVAIPVQENYFLVGLSNAPKDLERNLDLINSRDWIDLPIVYENRRRAVLVLQKGLQGANVLKSAFEAWK